MTCVTRVASLNGVRWVALLLVALTGCSTSSSGSPNETPGQCVLSNGIWYCGTGYGSYPQCPAAAAPTIPPTPCDYDGSTCFACYYDPAGMTCGCGPGPNYPEGGANDARVWECLPSGTGCSQ
jgi:hypothetical protein